MVVTVHLRFHCSKQTKNKKKGGWGGGAGDIVHWDFLLLKPFFKCFTIFQRQMATLVLCVRWWKQTLQPQGTSAILLVGHCITVKKYASAQHCTNQWCKPVDKCYQIGIQVHYTCFQEWISIVIMTVFCTSSHGGSILSAQNARTFKVHAASGS